MEFYAPWCPFCQRLEPIWNELPNRLKEKGVDTKIARMNVDTYVDYGERFGVTGFPTLMLFKDGRPVGQKTGLTDMNTLMKYAGYKESGPLAALAGAGAEMNLVLSGEQVRAAATLGMVQSFRRGGQTTLSITPELRERLDGCGASSAVPCLEAVMERVRSAAQRALGGGVLYPCGSLLIRLAHPHAASLVAPWGGTVQVPPCECLRPLL